MQVRFETEKAVGYFILVPEEAYKIEIAIATNSYFTYRYGKEGFQSKYELLEINNFTHLGTLGKLTEEQAAVIVDSLPSPMSHIYRDYKDYTREWNIAKSQYVFTLASKSLQSLADSLEVYNVNPFQDPKDVFMAGDSIIEHVEDMKIFEAAEARTGRWEIIFKLK